VPAPIKRLLVIAVCVLAAWYAHKPLLGAGFLGSDAAVLEDVGEAFEGGRDGAAWSVAALDHRPAAALSLAFSRSLHATDSVYTPGDAGRLRLEGLLILVIAAFGVRVAVIRALRPWTGEDHARAAGATAGAFLMIHPLIVPVVGHLNNRGDVVALAASAWSVALLLKGRQDRRAVAIGLAFALALVAAASSPSAWRRKRQASSFYLSTRRGSACSGTCWRWLRCSSPCTRDSWPLAQRRGFGAGSSAAGPSLWSSCSHSG
jgi:hypothetical protein